MLSIIKSYSVSFTPDDGMRQMKISEFSFTSINDESSGKVSHVSNDEHKQPVKEKMLFTATGILKTVTESSMSVLMSASN